jgi:hypothetical protein
LVFFLVFLFFFDLFFFCWFFYFYKFLKHYPARWLERRFLKSTLNLVEGYINVMIKNTMVNTCEAKNVFKMTYLNLPKGSENSVTTTLEFLYWYLQRTFKNITKQKNGKNIPNTQTQMYTTL